MGRHRRAALLRLLALALALGLVGAVAGAMAGGWWGTRQAARHEAAAVILLNPLQGNPFSPDARGDDLVNLETEAQLVTSDTVLKHLGSTHPELPPLDVSSVSVTIPTNTQLLDIAVSGATDAEATATAQALASTYLDFRRSRTSSALFNERANINEQISERSDERAALVSRLDALQPGSPGSSLLSQQILSAVTQIGELRTQLGEVGSASLDPGQVVTPAEVQPPGLLASGPRVPATVAALLGLLGGCLLAGRLGSRRDVVRTDVDLARLEVPVWGDLLDPDRIASAGTRMRSVLLAAHGSHKLVVLACASGASDARRSVAVLGDALVASHLRTLVIETDQRATADPGDSAPAGLTEVLLDQKSLDDTTAWSGDRGVLAAGHGSEALDGLVAAPEMAVLLLELRDAVDVVVLDAGAASSARAQALASIADVVLLELHVGTSTVIEVEDDLAQLRACGATTIGLSLVAPHTGKRWSLRTLRLRGAAGAVVRRLTSPVRGAVRRSRAVLLPASRRLPRMGSASRAGSARD
ncbi:hypothetical protein BH11ACT8_BH11ACT8_22190 [soil metagenome]